MSRIRIIIPAATIERTKLYLTRGGACFSAYFSSPSRHMPRHSIGHQLHPNAVYRDDCQGRQPDRNCDRRIHLRAWGNGREEDARNYVSARTLKAALVILSERHPHPAKAEPGRFRRNWPGHIAA